MTKKLSFSHVSLAIALLTSGLLITQSASAQVLTQQPHTKLAVPQTKPVKADVTQPAQRSEQCSWLFSQSPQQFSRKNNLNWKTLLRDIENLIAITQNPERLALSSSLEITAAIGDGNDPAIAIIEQCWNR